MYLIGLSESLIRGIKTVMVFAEALELICCKTVCESNDGAIRTGNIFIKDINANISYQ